ncbi:MULTISPECIES: extracellular solute-binding protein [unclassified Helicobacter]|uniref:extracellular solute-binding protein n=1 Tax=unclassified Helicobacter TaxID=2593540 RepID=UPI000CF0DDA2|nr:MULTISPECIES: extracellular solute-binding protein [unclassified Helicobacter]
MVDKLKPFFYFYFFCFCIVFAKPFIALDGEVKYKDLKHFDYVNINAKQGGVFRNYEIGSFDSLNPFILKGNPAQGLELIYDTLMVQSLDEPYSQYGLIADNIQVADDHFSVIFHINPLARFNDGVRVTAQDVKFSFDTLMQKGSIIFSQYYADVKEAKVLDSQNIQFVFKTNQNKELPLILGQLQILPKHFYIKNQVNTFGDNVLQKPLGSGPYSVESFDIGKKIIFKKNKDYWAKDLPVVKGFFNFDKVVFDYYKDESVALKAFLKGDYDWRIETTAKIWARGYVGKDVRENRIHKVMIKHMLPSGMQGFFMNARKEFFKNPLVREALLYAFDGEWSNKNLFFSQYSRTLSFFNNSIYAMKGKITQEELKILEPYQDLIAKKYPRLLKEEFIIPKTAGDGYSKRENLKYAQELLKKAGYEIKDFHLVDSKTKKPFVFTLTLENPAFERLALAYAKNLEILGIKMKIEIVDSSRYNTLVRNFNYDMIVGIIGQSLFPGNEQLYYWSSKSADTKGSRNYAGIKDEIVDDLIARLIKSKNKQEQIAITKSLDRVLSWGFYVIPHFYLPYYRIAYWDRIKMPSNSPLYGFTPYVWWIEE